MLVEVRIIVPPNDKVKAIFEKSADNFESVSLCFVLNLKVIRLAEFISVGNNITWKCFSYFLEELKI
jgi:hypothetical protein